MGSFKVVFLPSQKEARVESGVTLREAAIAAGEEMESICGGKGTCGRCRVEVKGCGEAGMTVPECLTGFSPAEEAYAARYGLRSGERLACQAGVMGDLVVFVPEENRLDLSAGQKKIGDRAIEIKPAVRQYTVNDLSVPLPGGRGDREALLKALREEIGLPGIELDSSLEDELFQTIKEGSREILLSVWDDHEIIRVAQNPARRDLGVALDIGTTTVAAYICDLSDGEILAADSVLNPQIRFGEDIMTRIAFARDNRDGLDQLNREIITAVNNLIGNLAEQAGLVTGDIVEVVMVGNTVMHHIFLGLDIRPLGVWPFSLAISESQNRKARDLGLDILPLANVHTLPVEAAFVGADNVGVILSQEPYNRDEALLIIDIGTNGELVLSDGQRMLSGSCATGPAFEGGNIRFGMRASRGAIDRFRMDAATGEVSFKVVGEQRWSYEMVPDQIQARGICGSGIIDIVAEMFKAGVIRPDGAFEKNIGLSRLRSGSDGKPEFVIALASETAIGRDIVVNQRDIRAVQLAKAAIYTGAMILLRRTGRERPDAIKLAGTFGEVIDPARALIIGMFPDCDPGMIHAVGNAAGDGARLALLNRDKRLEAEKVAREVEYVELTSEPGFNEAFLVATHFPSRNI